MATPVRNRAIMHCKPLGIEYFMYVYGLCLLFDFATKNLHLATIFYHLVDKWRAVCIYNEIYESIRSVGSIFCPKLVIPHPNALNSICRNVWTSLVKKVFMGVREWTEKVGWGLVSIKVIANDFLRIYTEYFLEY